MRLRLSVQRHELPTVKLLWLVAEDCTTVAKLLEQINEVIPLESDTWDVEDYVVGVRGYECLHYQLVSQVLKEEDKVCIRPLETSDIRARTVSGRYQISAGGAKLTDGIAYGRSRLTQISRPRIRIPPRKRPRLIATGDDEPLEGENSEESGRSSSQQLRIEAGTHNADDLGARAKHDTNSSSALIQSIKRKRPNGNTRRVSFTRSCLVDGVSGARFDIYEDEDEDSDSDDDYKSGSESSSSEESDSEAESDAENREPSQGALVLPKRRGKVHTVSPSSRSSSSSSSVSSLSPSSSPSTSSISSDSDASLSSDSSSLSSSSSDSSDSSDSSADETKGAKSKAGAKKSQGKVKVREGHTAIDAKEVSASQETQNEKVEKAPNAAQKLPVPPGQGKASTKARNERRKRSNAMKRAADQGQLPADSDVGGEVGSTPAIGSDTSAFEQRRQNLLDALAEGRGIDVEADLLNRQSKTIGSTESTTTSTSGKALRTPKSKQIDSQETPTFSTPDDLDDRPEIKKPRTRLDLASSRRLLFGSLGVRAPKTKEDEANLREHFMKSALSTVKRALPPLLKSSIDADQGVQQGEQAPEDSDAWKCKINLSAVECLDENVELSAPPFPFVQRWDPQQQNQSYDGARGKKRKRKNGYAMEELTAPNDILDYDGTGAGASASEYAPQLVDLPALPNDVSSLTALTFDDVKEGAVVAFKKLEVSQETNWQPAFSPYRTAVVEKLDDVDSLIRLRLAHRDRPSQKAQYDEEGYRIYGKFELPSHSDSEEEADDAGMEMLFSDMVEPKLVVAAPVTVASVLPTNGVPAPAAVIDRNGEATTLSVAGLEANKKDEAVSSVKDLPLSTLVATGSGGDARSHEEETASKKRDKKKSKKKSKGLIDASSRRTVSASFSPSVEPDPRNIPLPDSSPPVVGKSIQV